MTKLEMLLQIMQEECSEVTQACSKINRFGPNGQYPDGTGNIEQLIIEINDIHTLILMVEEEFYRNNYEMPKLFSQNLINAKRKRVEETLLKSIEKGCLTTQ